MSTHRIFAYLQLRSRRSKLLLASIALVLAGCGGGPGHVTAITVINPTSHAATVQVTGDDLNGWLSLGTTLPGSERVFEEVLSAGAEWTFRFVHVAHREEVTMTREELAGNDWRLEVPDRFGERLDQLGVESAN